MSEIRTPRALAALPVGSPEAARASRVFTPLTSRGAEPDVKSEAGPAWYSVAVLGAILLGAALRVAPVLGSSFPLDDGGLFYVMVRDLQAHHYSLPSYTSYNNAHIPFAYPPLGFYLAALLQDLTGWSLLDIFRFFPLVVSLLCIPAFALLAGALLGRNRSAAAAVVTFAVLPDSYYIELRGGGVTRAPGMLFALLTLFCVARLYQTRRPIHLAAGALCATLTVLSHPEWAWFTVYSSCVLLLTIGRNRVAVIHSAELACAATAVTAPWWLTVLSRHGLHTLTASISGSSAVWPWYLGLGRLLELHLTDELWLPAATVLALLGAVACLAQRCWLLPTWLLAACLVDARGLLDRSVIIVALLAGIGFVTTLLPALIHGPLAAWTAGAEVPRVRHRRLTAVVLGVVVIQAALGSYVWESYRASALSPGDRAAMTWARRSTPPASQFLLITATFWGRDDRSEWFPALAGRASLVTVQGYEWIPGELAKRDALSASAQVCATRGVACLDRWIAASRARVDYVYVAKGPPRLPQPEADVVPGDCCWSLRVSLSHDPQYRIVYDGAGAAIFRRV